MASVKLGSAFDELEVRLNPVTLPAGFTATELDVTSGLATSGSFTPDGRFIFSTKDGGIIVVKNGVALPNPLATIETDVNLERGLGSLALDPDFSENGYIYLNYTVKATPTREAHNRITRITVDGDVMRPGSEVIIFEFPDLGDISNHIGGSLNFGPDGKLYATAGDTIRGALSQDLSVPVGKVLRMNKDGSVPDDNPFVDTAGVHPLVWAYGLRNPFSAAFSDTGKYYINDVGNRQIEEINEGRAGANYGWPESEGPTTNPDFDTPIHSYAHSENGGAITGGTFYESQTNRFGSEYQGKYFFGDFVFGTLNVYDPVTKTASVFATDLPAIVDLDVDSQGRLWVTQFLSSGDSTIVVIDLPVNLRPSISIQPRSGTFSVGESATFTVNAFGSAVLRYQWFRNGNAISGATESTYSTPLVEQSNAGDKYTVSVTNANGSVLSNEAVITVSDNVLPTATIVTPAIGATTPSGTTVAFSGSATDAEDGDLPDSAYTWTINYITGQVVRPLLGPVSGIRQGTFTIPAETPYLETNVSYRVTLTVTDSDGGTRTVVREILPQTTTITLNSNVPNSITLDGIPATNGEAIDSVVGLDRPLIAAEMVVFNEETYVFTGWSDGGARERVLTVPSEALNLTATYELVPDEIVNTTQRPKKFALAAAGDLPIVQIYDETTRVFETQFLAFNNDFTGGVRVAVADLTGDGVDDYIVVPGEGGGPIARIFDGKTLTLFTEFLVFEEAFRGGLYVATGDFNGDSVNDLVFSAGNGGGPRVRVLDGKSFTTIADFFGIEDTAFRGGARVSVGDMNNDGQVDLLVSAGEGGGPRVTAFSGVGLNPQTTPIKLFNDFFVFEPELRNGTYVTLADLDGDGYADPVFGAGVGGAPRVYALSAFDLVTKGTTQVLANYFAGNIESRGGVTISAIRSVDGTRDDILTATGGQVGQAFVQAYSAANLLAGNNVPDFELQSNLLGGVYVS